MINQIKLANTIIIVLVIFAVFVYIYGVGNRAGKAEIQSILDKRNAMEQQALADQIKLNGETNAIVQKSHEENIRAIKSQAGRDAVDQYLIAHGMLSAGTALHSDQPSSSSQTDRHASNDCASSQSRASGSDTQIQNLAARCVSDALRLEDEWQAKAIREGWKIVD